MPPRSDLIACQNCAQLKVTCDKNLPCGKCADRGIICKPRYTRRRLASDSDNAGTRRRAQQDRQRKPFGNANSRRTSRNNDVSTPGPAPRAVLPTTSDAHYQLPWNPTAASGGANALNFPDEDMYHGIHPLSVSDIPINMFTSSQTETPAMVVTTESESHAASMGPPYTAVSLASSDDQSGRWRYDTYDTELDPWIVDGYTSPDLITQAGTNWPSTVQAQMTYPGSSQKRRHTGCHVMTESSTKIESKASADVRPLSQQAGSRADLSEQAFETHWSSFQCNPPTSSSNPIMVARHSLEGLSLHDAMPHEQYSRKYSGACEIKIENVDTFTRDMLIAINYSFAERALRLHRVAPLSAPQPAPANAQKQTHRDDDNIITLPPSNVLQSFLLGYVLRLEHTYPSIPAAVLRPNELIWDNSKHGALQLLLMVALGSMASTVPAVREMSKALTETCRVRLTEVLERRQRLDSKTLPVVLRSALLFTLLAGWSGTKFYMDLALAQHGLYMPMIRQSRVWGTSDFQSQSPEYTGNLEKMWKDWKEYESRKRLVYSCMTAFLEISIFYDFPCPVSTKDLDQAEPSSDELWHADTAETWHKAFEKSENIPKPSVLLSWCQDLENQQSWNESIQLMPIQLGYCLHRITVLAYHITQLQDSLLSGSSAGRPSGTLHPAHNEIKSLFSVWYRLARQCKYTDVGETGLQRSAMTTNLIKFHLVNLNTLVRFPDIEKIARDGPSWKSVRLCNGCTSDPVETWVHIGQVLRLIRSMPAEVRPPWWAAAVYRVALIGWATSLAHVPKDAKVEAHQYGLPNHGIPPPGHRQMLPPEKTGTGIVTGADTAVFAVDSLPLEDPHIQRYRDEKIGMPMLTGIQGSLVPLTNPQDILEVFVDVLQNDDGMDFTIGIRNKLRLLASRWNS